MPALPPALSPLDDDRLRQRAGARSFGLGVEYQRDAWCKHVVAVALAWRARRAGHADGPDAVEEFLATLDREQLVALLREQAAQDAALDRGLRLRATAANASADDEELIARFARQLDDALDPGGFLDRHEVLAYREGAEQAIDGLRSLLDAGRATAVIALAERLMDWELDGDWDTFYAADQTYADVLGDSGLARYRAAAEERFARQPARGPEDAQQRSPSGLVVSADQLAATREGMRRRALSAVL
ncbi:hypothetical protein AB0L40_02440 [Patulibacter sp. NPDC049589]|uniref:hypothetical protein n=1 Tax=Patulibacter sp. NPDC049589 TaxID=3154731 RepID=UPI0034497841